MKLFILQFRVRALALFRSVCPLLGSGTLALFRSVCPLLGSGTKVERRLKPLPKTLQPQRFWVLRLESVPFWGVAPVNGWCHSPILNEG